MSKTEPKIDNFISINHNGEFVYSGLNSNVKKKYKPDTPVDKPFVPYLIMVACCVIDVTCFYSLFSMISFSDLFLQIIQILGLVFGFDVVPIFLGIQVKRIKQRLSKDKFIIILSLIACMLALSLNVTLRIITKGNTASVFDLPSATSSTFSSATSSGKTEGSAVVATKNNEEEKKELASMIFGIVVPVITSIGSFVISYMTYKPLLFRKRNQEELLAEKKEEIRRLKAILHEYDLDPQFAEHLMLEDFGKFMAMKKMQRALVISYCYYVRQRLKEHLATPTAIDAISAEACESILERLDRELTILENTGVDINSDEKIKTAVSTESQTEEEQK